jgi:hypothetical protein
MLVCFHPTLPHPGWQLRAPTGRSCAVRGSHTPARAARGIFSVSEHVVRAQWQRRLHMAHGCCNSRFKPHV